VLGVNRTRRTPPPIFWLSICLSLTAIVLSLAAIILDE
jgi:hypothetical protein